MTALNQHRNPKVQGNVGLGAAIAYFCFLGYGVSLPLNDSQPYDLIVDDGHNLLRVQIKTVWAKAKSGRYTCDLRTTGGFYGKYTFKHFDPESCDLLFILTGDGSQYLIPASQIHVGAQLTLGLAHSQYLVSGSLLAI